MAHIQIFVARGCRNCAHSRDLAQEIRQRYPSVQVEVFTLEEEDAADVPEIVFATPTWLWDGEIYCLGNPDPVQLWRRLADLESSSPPIPIEEFEYERKDATSFDNGSFSGPL